MARIAGGRYAVPMEHVAEVGRPPHLTRVPGMPGWVLGVANWRGRVLAVLDLAEMLGASAVGRDGPGADGRGTGRLLVLTDGSMRVGLVTDGVEGATQQGGTTLPPTTLPPQSVGLVAGQMQDADGVLGLLSVPDVMALSSRLPGQRRTG